MCDCITKTQDIILDRLREDHPEREYSAGEFNGVSLSLNDTEEVEFWFRTFTHHFKAGYTFTKKNGDKSAERSHTVSIQPAYCSLCGEKLFKD